MAEQYVHNLSKNKEFAHQRSDSISSTIQKQEIDALGTHCVEIIRNSPIPFHKPQPVALLVFNTSGSIHGISFLPSLLRKQMN